MKPSKKRARNLQARRRQFDTMKNERHDSAVQQRIDSGGYTRPGSSKHKGK